MIKFEQLKGIIDEVTAQLNEIAKKMSEYSKIDTDYRASALIEEINKVVSQINGAYNNVFASDDFKDVYGKNSNYDFTEYVKTIREYVPKYEAIYQKIIKFESVFGFYN